MRTATLRHVKAIAITALLGSLLTGCYVVPINQAPPRPAYSPPPPMVVVTPAPRPVYTARLYPTNDIAAPLGRISGTISNPEQGHGEFSFTVANENFSGEATRAAGAAQGTANATGHRGSYVKCTYAMNNASAGTGKCVFSNGATFDMHISL
jgi:hypothetical protein